MTANESHRNFRVMGPDETESNRLGALLETTGKAWQAAVEEVDLNLSRHGRVMEMLSETNCQGWLEGYLLTGRHGLFSCYEAFVHIVDSMVNQHAKWLKVIRQLEWRRAIPSLNYLLTSHVWRQDHNGFSHQDPGFIDHVVNKKAEVVRVYLPPDANTLLSVADHCLRSRNYINVIVAGKQPEPNWLDMDSAALHCARGIGIWDWACTDDGDPDVIMACAGDVPTLETLAAVDILRNQLPDLRVRVVNVVDLMRLQPDTEHPHGLSDAEFDAIFTTDRPVIFAYHGYPWLIHRLTYRRHGHSNIHVRGYKEEGTDHDALRHVRPATTWTASISSLTSLIAYRDWRGGRRPSASTWSTAGPSTRATSGVPERTCPKCVTGRGAPATTSARSQRCDAPLTGGDRRGHGGPAPRRWRRGTAGPDAARSIIHDRRSPPAPPAEGQGC